tara:strand:+ start:241 stop:597 length:357 start_codon:yes stop_codon:yes gene_type:complete
MESKLEKFTFNNDRPLIYFLLYKGKVVYVGKTMNFLSRIVAHQRTEPKYKKWVDGKLIHRGYDSRLKKFDEVYIKEVEDEEMLVDYERRCIKKFLPKYNTCAYATRQHKKEARVEPSK